MSEKAQELYGLINTLELEVCSGVITTDEAAQLLTYGNIVEQSY